MRRYLALRSEVDRLLQLVRELNATAEEMAGRSEARDSSQYGHVH